MFCLVLIVHYIRLTEGNDATTINATVDVNIKTDFK
jgi:hypothetical protein